MSNLEKPRGISVAVSSFVALTVGYLIILIWADSRHQVFSGLSELASVIPALVTASAVTYLIRYVRWHWLLCRSGYPTPFLQGFAAYHSGFAFTATPGKVGELVRIRYFQPLGVPGPRVVAAFVFERAFDLISVLILASLAIASPRVFIISAGFVITFLVVLAIACSKREWFSAMAYALLRQGFVRTSQMVSALGEGLSGSRVWITSADIGVSLILGLIAWSIASFAFVYLLDWLHINMPSTYAFSTYPVSMLAGAASMLPGGVGSTEATIVALLALQDVPIGAATLAAVGIRLSSLWFAIVTGFVSLIALEKIASRRQRSVQRSWL